jgi:hypothetical protein
VISTLAFTLAAMHLLSPHVDHTALATAVADRVDAELPLFADDEARTKTTALMVSVAFRESSLRNDIGGDQDSKGRPTSFCAFQVHLPNGARTRDGWSGADLKADPAKCTLVAFRMLRESMRVDAANPVAFYARGPRYQSDEARRISKDRVRLAARLLASAEAGR